MDCGNRSLTRFRTFRMCCACARQIEMPAREEPVTATVSENGSPRSQVTQSGSESGVKQAQDSLPEESVKDMVQRKVIDTFTRAKGWLTTSIDQDIHVSARRSLSISPGSPSAWWWCWQDTIESDPCRQGDSRQG